MKRDPGLNEQEGSVWDQLIFSSTPGSSDHFPSSAFNSEALQFLIENVGLHHSFSKHLISLHGPPDTEKKSLTNAHVHQSSKIIKQTLDNSNQWSSQ